MSPRLAMVALLAFAFSWPIRAADPDPRLQELQGSWQLESMEHAGAKVADVHVAGASLFVGGRNAVFKKGPAISQFAVIRPIGVGDKRYINLAVLLGEDVGGIHLGLYRVQGDTLQLCYDTAGIERPADFKTAVGTKITLANYKRRPPRAPDPRDLTGSYTTASDDEAGNVARGEAIIEKLGDSYSVIFKRNGNVAFVGIGIRQGDTLSVSWRSNVSAGLSVYKIADGKKMTGTYTMLGGNGRVLAESLTPEDI